MTHATKTVDILYRVVIKASGIIVYIVLSSDGVTRYNVTVVRGKVNSCSCPSYKPCKHMKAVQAREDSRAALPAPEPAPTPAPVANEWRDCELCGKPTRSADGVCVRCYGPYAEDEQEVVTSEVTTSEVETQHGTCFPAGTTLYHVGDHIVFWEMLFGCYGCTCRETSYGMSYEPCQHTKAVQRVLDTEKSAA